MKKIRKIRLNNASVLTSNELLSIQGGMHNSDDCSASLEQCNKGTICSGAFEGSGTCGLNSQNYCACIPSSI